MTDFYIELHPIPIKLIVIGVEEVMSLLLEVINDILEFGSEDLHSL